MKVKLSSLKYEIISNGTVLLFDENADFTLKIDDEQGFKFDIILMFKFDESGNKVINRKIINNSIEMTCMNFDENGTGTSIPIEVATIKGKKMYIAFWSYLDGDVEGQKKSRSVKYTLFIER